jgi:hypothetical protein
MVETYDTLCSLVDLDIKDHKIKEIASLFLEGMTDWPTYNQTSILEYINELDEYFGSPLTIEKINSIAFNGQNAWNVESGSSISELISISIEYYNERDFTKIVDNFLNYYNEEFKKVDFIAELQYLTEEQGERKTLAYSGYRPQIKFDFTEICTSGQQTFIDSNLAQPGCKITAKIKLASPEVFINSLNDGMKFEFGEGAITIGTGQITYIVNENLEK